MTLSDGTASTCFSADRNRSSRLAVIGLLRRGQARDSRLSRGPEGLGRTILVVLRLTLMQWFHERLSCT